MCIVKTFKKCRNFRHTIKGTIAWWEDEYKNVKRPKRDELIRVLVEKEKKDIRENLIEDALRKLHQERIDKMSNGINNRLKLKKQDKKEKCKDATWTQICEDWWDKGTVWD